MTDTPRLIAVGTHHKTGTVWLRRVFNIGSDTLNIPRIRVNGPRREDQIPATGRAVVVNWDSAFSDALLARDDLRGLHMIRDPRDVLISGMRYHQIAPEAGEKALHVPRKELNGQSYQQHLKSLETLHEKMLFEMQNMHLRTLNQMTAWRYDRPNIHEVRYEDLMQDQDCAMFANILDFLGFTGTDKDTMLDIYWANSLFGGMKEKSDRPRRVSLHIQSGEAAQWTTKLPRSVAEIYAKHHGQALIDLGYETDMNWISRCPESVDLVATTS
ncbi:sulfotransferase domain-containing protein [Rhodophyticola sp. CCM32]|uniref:sulfotransferase domain-containing protein n=1 Tax=Rhodophyticola sp. CCM32 TaxID=2916397 RepID=UPI00143DCF68|nr:sulfotransferase domain-containing protein [Rhodophyticola sp. CCM32]